MTPSFSDAAITLDTDWAPDFVIDDVASRLLRRGVRATWFVTHSSPAIGRRSIAISSSSASIRTSCLNAHAGDLPRFRGNAVPEPGDHRGERQLVVTIHVMADEVDAGPILLQRACPLSDDTYIGDVYAFMTANIPTMFADAVDGLAAATLIARPQSTDPAAALRCYPRRPEDGYLDWREPAINLGRLVRASAEPFAGAFTVRDGTRIIVWRARTAELPSPVLGVPGQVIGVRTDTGTVDVLTGDGVLALEEVQLEGQARCPAAAVIRSTRERLGRSPASR